MDTLLTNAMTIVSQVLVMFILIGLGALAVFVGWLSDEGIRDINRVLLYIVMPIVVLHLLNQPFNKHQAQALLLMLGLAIVAHGVGIALSSFCFHHTPDDERCVLTSSALLSNSSFMSIPIVTALAGDIGAFYLTPYLVVFNVVAWTYGVRMMESHHERRSWGKLVLNPTLIAVAVGLTLYVLQIPLPPVLSDVTKTATHMNTPLAMLLIGAQIARHRPSFRPTRALVIALALRNVVVPFVILALLLVLTRNRTLIYAGLIPAAAPTAATVVLFATRFSRNVKLAAETLALSTLFSVITLPVLIALSDILMRGGGW